jgi:hypothetical protein
VKNRILGSGLLLEGCTDPDPDWGVVKHQILSPVPNMVQGKHQTPNNVQIRNANELKGDHLNTGIGIYLVFENWNLGLI